MEVLVLFIMGAFGALVKDILKDNYVTLPCLKEGKFYLGCLGGLIIGAIAGYIVDNDPITAFLGGYAGIQIIEGLTNKKNSYIMSLKDGKETDSIKKVISDCEDK